MGRPDLDALTRALGDVALAGSARRREWRSFTRSWALVTAGAAIGRTAVRIIALVNIDGGPISEKVPAIASSALRADLIVELSDGFVAERQALVRRRYQLRWRGRGGIVEGVLSPNRDDLVWQPSRYWRDLDAADVLIERRVIRRVELVTGRFANALVIDAEEGTAWFVIPRRSVRRT